MKIKSIKAEVLKMMIYVFNKKRKGDRIFGNKEMIQKYSILPIKKICFSMLFKQQQKLIKEC